MTKIHTHALCLCGKCKTTFVEEIRTDIDDLMEDLSKNGCALCKKETDEKPCIYIIKGLTQKEITAYDLVKEGFTKYCEFDDDFVEPMTELEEFYNSVCKFSYF